MNIITIVFAGGPLDGKLLAVTDNTQHFVTHVYEDIDFNKIPEDKIEPVQVKHYTYFRTNVVIKNVIVFR